MGFYCHKVVCSPSEDETPSPPRHKQRNVKVLSSISQCVTSFFHCSSGGSGGDGGDNGDGDDDDDCDGDGDGDDDDDDDDDDNDDSQECKMLIQICCYIFSRVIFFLSLETDRFHKHGVCHLAHFLGH